MFLARKAKIERPLVLRPARKLTNMTVAAVASLIFAFGVPTQTATAQGKNQEHVTAAIGMDVTSTDPHKISGGGEYFFFSNVFEGLYGHDLKGNLAPLLATGHKVSEDGRVYDFTLRKGVTFHNGEPFTAEDVRFSWKRAIDPKLKNPRASILATNIEDVEIVDDYRIRIHLKKPDAALLENLGEYWYIVPKDYVEKVGNEGYAQHPVGTGPYKFVDRRISEYIELEAYKDHWGRVPGIDRLTLRIVPDPQTRIAMLQTGQADIITNVPPYLAKGIDAAPGTKTIVTPGYQNIYINVSSRKKDAPWASQKVRQALNYAIDKQTIIDKVMFGYATPSAAPCAIGVIGCDIGKEPYPYDPKKARKLLEEAGFDFDRTYRFVGLAPGRTPQSKAVTEAIAHYLSQVGIKTKIDIMEYGSWIAFVRAKEFDSADLIFWTWTDYNNDPMGRLPRQVVTDGSYSWTSRPELDETIGKANAITDPEKRKEHLRKIFTELYENPPFIILWTVDNIYGARENIEWTPRVNVSWPVFWKLDTKS